MCPVKAMARLMHEGRHQPSHTKIGRYSSNHTWHSVTARHVRDLLRDGARQDNLVADGYDLSRIGTHSLRSGGAVALKLAGHDSDTIKKLGRWSSNTYLLYIQSQIAQLMVDVSATMMSGLRLHNLG